MSFQLPQDQTQDFHELFRDLHNGVSDAEIFIDVVWSWYILIMYDSAILGLQSIVI